MMNYIRLATTFTGYFKQGENIIPPTGEVSTLESSFISPFTVATTVSSESKQITGIYFQRLSIRSFLALIPLTLIGLICMHVGFLIYHDPAPFAISLLTAAAVITTLVLPLVHITILLLWSQSPSPYRRYLIHRHYPNIPTHTISYKELRKLLK